MIAARSTRWVRAAAEREGFQKKRSEQYGKAVSGLSFGD